MLGSVADGDASGIALAQEQFRRERKVALLGQAAADILDVFVYPEDLLYH